MDSILGVKYDLVLLGLTRAILRIFALAVEWARYKERDARFGAGLENSFSSFDQTSLCIKTSVVRERGQAAE